MDKKAEIYRCAKELFSAKGFKATNVSEITKMAGIATGTFYLYYPSKEELFMEIYLEENVKLKQASLALIDPDGEPLEVIQNLMIKNQESMRSNPILREWYNKDVFNKIEESYNRAHGLDHMDFVYSVFLELIEKWQAEGKFRQDIDSRMIMAIFTAMITIDSHKDEIGFQYFPEIQDYLTEFIMAGLTDFSKVGAQGNDEN
jgi:AcrR family transcriptional regulator